MGDGVLSQAEVESLLNSMDSGAPAKPAEATRNLPKSREKIMPYDFRRPERVGKEQMRALQSLHDGFARNFGASLSALLRSIIDVKLTSVDQLTYSEFVFSLENPTCFNVLKADPLEGNLILDINPSILFPVLDRLLGGGKDSGAAIRRPLTEIELKLVSRLTGLFLEELRKAWEGVLALKLSVEKVESNPQLVQIVPPNEVIVLISFELMLGETRGMINLCIPFNSIERVSNKLTANNWVSYSKGGNKAESMERIRRNLSGAMVELVVTLAETKITTSDLLGLRVGDIITTDKDVQLPLEVSVQGQPKYGAKAGAFKGQKAIELGDVIAPGLSRPRSEFPIPPKPY
jgi:flagellar motor switch protein FliM